MHNIMIFDSGAGGLSIALALIEKLRSLGNHACQINYLADDLFFPYGLLSEETVLDRVRDCVMPLVNEVDPDILVVACNTASTIVLPVLRAALQIPVVGVVPAIKPAANKSERKHIGLLATPATIQRSYTDELISQFATNVKVTKVGSCELVEMAEKLLEGLAVSVSDVADILAPMLGDDYADVIVLGCTHFPLLHRQLNEAIALRCPERKIQLIDSGAAIAKRIIQLLDIKADSLDGEIKTRLNFVLYSTAEKFRPTSWHAKVVTVLGESIDTTIKPA
ncbi:MAG: glutamate racemase [Hahellaceae bacterium]|nr:glutamate racemase [Hahellaceae bacterium]MCP5212352.1 glutamate racemase [Hahellaceae bacterium]